MYVVQETLLPKDIVLQLDVEEATTILELLAQDIDESIEDEYAGHRNRLQAIYDRLQPEVEKRYVN